VEKWLERHPDIKNRQGRIRAVHGQWTTEDGLRTCLEEFRRALRAAQRIGATVMSTHFRRKCSALYEHEEQIQPQKSGSVIYLGQSTLQFVPCVRALRHHEIIRIHTRVSFPLHSDIDRQLAEPWDRRSDQPDESDQQSGSQSFLSAGRLLHRRLLFLQLLLQVGKLDGRFAWHLLSASNHVSLPPFNSIYSPKNVSMSVSFDKRKRSRLSPLRRSVW
jgi:hypothetical protein